MRTNLFVQRAFGHYSEQESKYKTLSDTTKSCRGHLVFDQTVFYAEGGGQVGDIGFIGSAKGRCYLKIL